MLEQLLVWERDAFFMLNGSDSAFLDRFMWIYSGKAVWLPLAFFILVVLCYKKNWEGVVVDLIGHSLDDHAMRPVRFACL
ncbi:hypothetical protein NXW21_15895 [Parabacteroides distasonis]|nr:hypothetical protein [Parabacteroides distasonis]